MPNLPVYTDAAQKAANIDRQEIITKDAFNAECLPLLNQQNAFYRGLPEARYRLYSAAQREWITKELVHRFGNFDVFINELISYARQINNGLILSFMDHIGASNSDIALLSFLQHYGAPTPFIDFTHDFGTALFFAVDGNKYLPSDNPLDQFFSVYILREQADFINFKDVLLNNIQILQSILSQYPIGSISNANQLIQQLLTPSFSNLVQYNHIFYLSDFVGGAPLLRLNTNLNIIAQRGMFVLNPSPDEPLEQYMTGIISSVAGRTTSSSNMPRIQCFDIHKNLIEYVLSILLSRGITRSTVYPQEEGFAKLTYAHILSNYP